MLHQTRPGSRVVVSSADMNEDLGSGTFVTDGLISIDGLGDMSTPTILLDSGKIVFGFQTYWAEVEGEAAPAMEVMVSTTVRLFRATDTLSLACCEQSLAANTAILVEALEPRLYDHRLQLAARFVQGGKNLYFLVCEGGLPTHYTEAPE